MLLIFGAILGLGWYFFLGPGADEGIPFIPFLQMQESDEVDPNTVLQNDLGCSSCEDNTAVDLQFPKRTIHDALCFLWDKDIPFLEHEPHMDNLHMKAWGINGITANGMRTEYNVVYYDEGFTTYAETTDSGVGWTAYSVAWSKDNDVRSAIFADGPSVEANYGYETVIVTGYGLVSDYVAYNNFLSRY